MHPRLCHDSLMKAAIVLPKCLFVLIDLASVFIKTIKHSTVDLCSLTATCKVTATYSWYIHNARS